MNIKLEFVYGNVSDETSAAIIEFWKSVGALPEGEDASERSRQAAVVAKDEEGNVVGICTAKKMFVERLGNNFLFYRSLVAPNLRRAGLARTLLVAAIQKFESMAENGVYDECKGLFIVVESPLLQAMNQAIWPASGAVFIGKDKDGRPIRVRYFKGTTI